MTSKKLTSGDYLCACRIRANLSMKDLDSVFSFSEQFLSRMETGQKKIPPARVRELCKGIPNLDFEILADLLRQELKERHQKELKEFEDKLWKK